MSIVLFIRWGVSMSITGDINDKENEYSILILKIKFVMSAVVISVVSFLLGKILGV